MNPHGLRIVKLSITISFCKKCLLMNYKDNSVPVVSNHYQPTRFANVGSIHKPHGQVCPCSFRTLGAFINCMAIPSLQFPNATNACVLFTTEVITLISAYGGPGQPAVVGNIHKPHGRFRPYNSISI